MMEMFFTFKAQRVSLINKKSFYSLCVRGRRSSADWLNLAPPVLVHGLGSANTHAIYGQGADKELTELVPGIINQLGPDSLASLRKLAESYQAMNAAQQSGGGVGKEDDDEVPDVVS